VSYTLHPKTNKQLHWGETIERGKKILKAHWNSNYDTIITIKKISKKQIQRYRVRTPTIIAMGHMQQVAHLHLSSLCGPLRSPFVMFFCVNGFIWSRFLWWYLCVKVIQIKHKRRLEFSIICLLWVLKLT
jgi:hypothetical protein